MLRKMITCALLALFAVSCTQDSTVQKPDADGGGAEKSTVNIAVTGMT